MPRNQPFMDEDIADNLVFRNLITNLYLEIEKIERQFGSKSYLNLLKAQLSRIYMIIVLTDIQMRS